MTPSVESDISILLVEPASEDGPDLDRQFSGATAFAVHTATDANGVRDRLRDRYIDCAVCVHDPPAVDGVEMLSLIRELCPDLPVLLATESEAATDVIETGATDVVRLADGAVDREVVSNRIGNVVAGSRERGKFEQLFEQANDGIAIHDAETGAVLDANRRLYELVGADREGSTSLALSHLATGESPYTEDAARERVRGAASEGPESFEWQLPGSDGEPTWVEISVKPVTIAGRRRVLSFVRSIADRKERERLVRDRQRQFEAVFDHPLSFTAVLGAEGRVRRVNQPALDLIDATESEVEGTRLWELPWWPAETGGSDRIRAAVDAAAEGEDSRLEIEIGGGDGERVIDLAFQPISTDASGDVDSVVAVGFDITERKRRERALDESRRALERLHEITADPDLRFEDQVEELLAFGCAYLGTDVAFLSRIDREADSFEIARSHGDHELLEPGAEHSLGRAFCRHTVGDADGSLAIRDAVAEGMGDDPAYETYGFGCYLGSAVTVDGDLYGTLCFAGEEPRETPFSATERTVFDTIRQWLRHELERDQYRREVEETRDRLERILKRVDDGFFALDEDWRITYANEEGAAVLRGAMGVNYGKGSLLGRHLWEEMPEAVDTAFYEHYTEAMETQEPVSFEAYFEPIGRWFDVNAYPDEDGISVYFEDITNSKQRERILNDLLETTRRFMQARDESELAELVVEATSEILGYDSNIVRLHDAEAGTLPPTILSQTGAERLPDPPMYEDDEGIAGQVFQSGESLVMDDLAAETAYDYGPFRSAVVLPLGDHGTLGIGSEEPNDFGDEDAALAELLATTARVALDRIDRETELRRFRRVIEHVEEMVFLLDREGDFTFVTEPFAAFLGLSRDRLGDRALDEFVAGANHRAYADRLDELDDDGERTVAFETTLETRTGDERPVELRLSTFPADVPETGIVGTVTDIRELTETRAQLEAERDRFRHLFENLPDPVVEVEIRDSEPMIQRANPAFIEIFGYEGETIDDRSLDELIVPADPATDGPVTDVTADERTSREAQRKTASGRRDFLVRGIPYRWEGREYGFGIYTDITEQKERERYLQVLNRVLRHNLRNDLNVIMLSAQWLAANVEGDLRERAEILREHADELAGLSEKAKEIERMIGRRGSATGPVDAVSVLERVVAEYGERHPGVDLSVDLPSELWVRADEDVARVFEELIENAIVHNDGAAPSLRIEAAPAPASDWVDVRVHDDGAGLPDDEWQIIAGETEITQLTHSSGLGLWLVRWVIESYGGEIRRERSDESGTTIRLRLRPADAEGAPADE